MESTLEQYIHLGASLSVAVAVLIMINSVFSLRREAQVILENKAYYEEIASYKRKFDGFDKEELSASDVISIISQYADEIDIYVVGTSYNNNATCKIDFTNRYLLDYISPTTDEVRTALGCNSLKTEAISLAKEYGINSAQALGQLFYGTDKWTAQLVYDGKDVTSAVGETKDSVKSRISGIRILKK